MSLNYDRVTQGPYRKSEITGDSHENYSVETDKMAFSHLPQFLCEFVRDGIITPEEFGPAFFKEITAENPLL